MKVFQKLKAKVRPPRRQYPIKRDEYGASARSRCFDQYDHGYTPKDVYESMEISLRTARRYYADWKKRPSHFEVNYRLMKLLLKNGDSDVPKIIEGIGRTFNMTSEEVQERLERTWGLRSLMLKRWPKVSGPSRWVTETQLAACLRRLTGWPTPLIDPRDNLRALALLEKQLAQRRQQARIDDFIASRSRLARDNAEATNP